MCALATPSSSKRASLPSQTHTHTRTHTHTHTQVKFPRHPEWQALAVGAVAVLVQLMTGV